MQGRKPVPTNLAVLRGNPGKKSLGAAEPQPDIEHLPVPADFHRLGDIAESAIRVWEALMPELVRWGLVSRMDEDMLKVYAIAVARKEHADLQVAMLGTLIKTPNGYPMQNPYLSISNKQAEIIKAIAAEFGLSPAARVRLAGTAQPGLQFGDPLATYERGA